MSEATAETLFKEVADLHYKQWTGRLLLGVDMSVKIQLCPPPKNFSQARDFSVMTREISHNLVIKGYLAMSDISSPPVFSRHLVLPLPSDSANEAEDSKAPNTCVFLHGALKAEWVTDIL